MKALSPNQLSLILMLAALALPACLPQEQADTGDLAEKNLGEARGEVANEEVETGPVQIVLPVDQFRTDGNLRLVVKIAKGFYDQVIMRKTQKHNLAEARIEVQIEGEEAPRVYLVSDSGTVAPIALNPQGKSIAGYYWTIDLDLTKAQCRQFSQKVHHCDGCGRAFETKDGTGLDCRAKVVGVTVSATNKPGNPVCDRDIDGDGRPECDASVGLLSPFIEVGEDKYVPAKFWSNGDEGGECIARSHNGVLGGACKPIGNQGCDTCGDNTGDANDEVADTSNTANGNGSSNENGNATDSGGSTPAQGSDGKGKK